MRTESRDAGRAGARSRGAAVRPSRVSRLAAASAIALALGWAAPGGAAGPADRSCAECHSHSALSGGPLYVDPAVLAASAHREVACADCHAGAGSVPHPPGIRRVRCERCHGEAAARLARSAHGGAGRSAPGCVQCHGGHDVRPASRLGPRDCARCHPEAADDVRGGVHGEAFAAGDTATATCRSCHGPAHDALPARDPRSPTHRARLAGTCGGCHADRELMTRRKIAIPEAQALYARSVHGRSDKPEAAICTDCHESHRLRRAGDPASPIFRGNIPATCGRCHARERTDYESGIHGMAVRRGVTRAPVCTDCHGEHLIRGPRDPGSPVGAAAVTMTCAHCHEAEGIRETYGLPAGRLATYRDSFHGLAARGGSPAVANCASCHGYHQVLPSTDPRSAVSPERLPETCGRCHPGAGARFAAGPVHVAMATPANPVLFVARWIYLVLIVGVVGGMALHNGLDFAAKLRRHWRRHAGGPGPDAAEPDSGIRHLRMTGSERWQHGLLAASFFTLAYTGFALKFPESWLFAWLARLEHGYEWRSQIHRWAAVTMTAACAWHVVYLFSRRGRETLAALRPRWRDVGDVFRNLAHMAGLRRQPPAFDRFGYVEKAEYWALVWGTVVMTATGVVLWFENLSLRWLDKWMLDLATLVHYYEAWLAFLAILVWHVYHTVLNPDVYPMDWTWITGRVSEERLRHEHPAEWARLAAARETAAAGAAAGDPAPAGPEDGPPTPDSRPAPSGGF